MKTKGWNGYGERGIKILEVRVGWKNGNYFFVERYIYVRVCGWKEGGNFLKLREINLLMSSNVALSEDV